MQDGNWHMTADEDHAKATTMIDATIDEALAAEKARQEHYEESVVGALNERNIRDARRAGKAEAQVARIRAFLEDMAGWCSPHGVAADYAQRGLDALDGVDRLGVAGPATRVSEP